MCGQQREVWTFCITVSLHRMSAQGVRRSEQTRPSKAHEWTRGSAGGSRGSSDLLAASSCGTYKGGDMMASPPNI